MQPSRSVSIRLRATLAPLLAAALVSAAHADVALLRSGRSIEVSGYRLEGERIVLLIEGGGEMALQSRQVVSIQKSVRPEIPLPGTAPVGTSPAPALSGTEPLDALEPGRPNDLPEAAPRPLGVSAPPGPDSAARLPRAAIESLAARIARKYAVEERLVLAVIEVESRYDARAVSPRGAIGLMQLMPQTAARFAVTNPYDPGDNIDGGVRYLKELLDRYSGQRRLALAAYNAGEEAVERFSGIPPFRETILYVDRVLKTAGR